MKIINADEFLHRLYDYAITDEDRKFTEKVKFALQSEPTLDAIAVEYLQKYAEAHPGYTCASIKNAVSAWEKEALCEWPKPIRMVRSEDYELIYKRLKHLLSSDYIAKFDEVDSAGNYTHDIKTAGEESGQSKGKHISGGERAADVAADRQNADGSGTAPDRRLCTPEGMQQNIVFCVPETAGRRKGTQGNSLIMGLQQIEKLLIETEPIEDLNDIIDRVDAIREYAFIIKNSDVDTLIKALVSACDLQADRASDIAEDIELVFRRVIKKVSKLLEEGDTDGK